MLNTVMVIGSGHPYFDKRVFSKSVQPLSKLFAKVLYVTAAERGKVQGLVPGNIEDISVGNMPIKTINRTLQWDRIHRSAIYNYDKPIDLIVLHDIPIGYVFPGAFLRRIKGKFHCKIVIDLHEYLPECLFPSIPTSDFLTLIDDKMIVGPYLKEADGYFAVCDFVQEYILRKGISKRKIFVLPNYAHSIPTNYVEKTDSVGFVGRLNRFNGPERIAKIAKTVIEEYGYEFRFIGTSKEGAIGLFGDDWLFSHDKVTFLGMLPYNEMLYEISKLKFAISHFEVTAKNTIHSLPNKFFDCIVSKTPIIIPSQLKEQRKILEEYDIGYSVDLDNNQWIQELRGVFTNQKEYDRKSHNIEKHYREFLWDSHEREYLNFVERIMKTE